MVERKKIGRSRMSVRSQRNRQTEKKVVFRIPEPLHTDIKEFAQERKDSVVGLFRWCLAVGRAIWLEMAAGNRIVVVARDGEFKKELIFTR